jgi:hypothetical protein
VRTLRALVALVLGIAVLAVVPRPAVAATSELYITDSTGEVGTPAVADITNASINYWHDAITVTLDVAQWTDPATDPGWGQFDVTNAAWLFDVDDDGNADFTAVMRGDDHGGLVAAVGAANQFYDPRQSNTGLCNADAVAVSPGYRLSFPAACIGSPASVKFLAYMDFGAGKTAYSDSAPDQGFAGPVSPSSQVMSDGGYVTDDWGGIHPYNTGGAPPPPVVGPTPYWPGHDVVRGNAATFGGGYVVDDWGGIHWYKTRVPGVIGRTPHDGPYWPGKDVVRGIALLPGGTGGYVLDDWGGLHPFGLGAASLPPVPQGGPYWLGKDVARGVAILPDGSGGYVVDDWGAFHPFVIPGHTMPAQPTDGPYWFGQDVVRGVVTDRQGNGGYVVDDWGGIHMFSVPGTAGPIPPPEEGPYWAGQDVARGISVVPWDPPPTPPPSS